MPKIIDPAHPLTKGLVQAWFFDEETGKLEILSKPPDDAFDDSESPPPSP